MTTTEHLERIVAKCRANLALAEKRTPGKWTVGGDGADIFGPGTAPTYHDSPHIADCQPSNSGLLGMGTKDISNARYIAACAGSAEAGWRSTIAAIETLQKCTMLSTANHQALQCAILNAWPEELLS